MTPHLGDGSKRAIRMHGVLQALALGSTVFGLGCSVSDPEPADAGTLQDAHATMPDTWVAVPDGGATMLDRVAAIVVPNCAVSGCHDAQTKEHGMDLSTGPKIYEAWVNQLGFDHCRNMGRVRVVPGSAETSLVMTMITGPLCEAWPRMPPPPRDALTTAQIEVIRAWIGAGAPIGAADAGVGEAGADVADVSLDHADDISVDTADGRSADVSIERAEDGGDEASNDAIDSAADDATDATTSDLTDDFPIDDVMGDGAPDGADDASDACSAVRRKTSNLRPSARSAAPVGECTDTVPCSAGLMCVGTSCADAWTCIPHLQGPGEHPCPPDNVPYCGCDGVTFMSPLSCADRPWAFEGACADGVSCDASTVPCEVPPSCPAGQVPSLANGGFGYCVDVKWCRCNATTKCPESYTCNSSTQRCSAPTRDK